MPEELRILHTYCDSVRHQELLMGVVGLLLILLGAIVAWTCQQNRRAFAIALICFGILSLPLSFIGFFGFRHMEVGAISLVTETPGSLCAVEAFHLRPQSFDFTPQIATLLIISVLGAFVGWWSRHKGRPHREGVAFAVMIVFLLLAASGIPTRNASLRFHNDLVAIGCAH